MGGSGPPATIEHGIDGQLHVAADHLGDPDEGLDRWFFTLVLGREYGFDGASGSGRSWMHLSRLRRGEMSTMELSTGALER